MSVEAGLPRSYASVGRHQHPARAIIRQMDTRAIEMAARRSQPVLYTFILATLEWLRTSRTVRLLDVGCGRGHLLTVLAAAGYSDLTGCDGLEHPDLCLRCVFQQEKLPKVTLSEG